MYIYRATAPDGKSKNIHLSEEPTASDLVDAVNRVFPEEDLAQSEITGRNNTFRIELREGGTFVVERQERESS